MAGWGRITDTNDAPVAGATVISGIFDDLGGESGCGIYNINDFGCTVPYGWSGVFTPKMDSYRFEPPTIVIDTATNAEGLRLLQSPNSSGRATLARSYSVDQCKTRSFRPSWL